MRKLAHKDITSLHNVSANNASSRWYKRLTNYSSSHGLSSYDENTSLPRKHTSEQPETSKVSTSLDEIPGFPRARKPVDLHIALAVAQYACRGALKAFLMGYAGRSTLTFLLKLIRLSRSREKLIHLLAHSFFGSESFMFGTFLGCYTFTWKFLNNHLRLSGLLRNEKAIGFISGFIASAAIAFENRSRRVMFAQQMSTRSLQTLYNALKHRNIVHFPPGDSLIFILGSAQIMYAFVMHPHTIPPEFYRFMCTTSRHSDLILRQAANTTMGRPVNVSAIQKHVLKSQPTTQATQYVLSDLVPSTSFIPCSVLHPSTNSCIQHDASLWFNVFKQIFPVYASLNFVPLVVLKLKQFIQNPSHYMRQTLFNTAQSSAFLATFVSLFQTGCCAYRNLVEVLPVAIKPQHDQRYIYYLIGILSSTSIFMEFKNRRSELAMYVVPKAVESLWKVMRQRGLAFELRAGSEILFFATAMGGIMAFYQTESQHISPIVARILAHVLGLN